MGLGVIYQFFFGDFGDVKDMLLGFLVSFTIGFITWLIARGGIGGGDVKLMAVIGIWFGYYNFLFITFIASFLGILWALIDYIKQKKFTEKTKGLLNKLKLTSYLGLGSLDLEHKDLKKPIPFGACIALATILIYFI